EPLVVYVLDPDAAIAVGLPVPDATVIREGNFNVFRRRHRIIRSERSAQRERREGGCEDRCLQCMAEVHLSSRGVCHYRINAFGYAEFDGAHEREFQAAPGARPYFDGRQRFVSTSVLPAGAPVSCDDYCAGSMRSIAPLTSSVATYSSPSGPC